MSRRVTISLPDDVAENLDKQPNASAYVAQALREQFSRDVASFRELFYQHSGVLLTDANVTRGRARLAAARARIAASSDPRQAAA